MTATLSAAHPQAQSASCSMNPDEMEREIERRVAIRCQADMIVWRFRLITAETMMFGLLVGAAGLALKLPGGQILRAALVVSASSFASGILLLCLSSAWLRMRALLRRRTRP